MTHTQPTPSTQPTTSTPPTTPPTTQELKTKFREYLIKSKKFSLREIEKDLSLSETEVYGLISLLQKEGYHLDIIDGRLVKSTPLSNTTPYKVPSHLNHLRLLLISDTHLASKYDRLDILRYLYDKADSTHTNYILHSGDMTEGFSGRPQQIHELRELSYTGQRDYVIDKYPISPPDCPTYFIAGNHDLWWIKQCGADICQDISNNRSDLIYLGSDCEDLHIGRLRIRLYHGKGGSSYARSYKLQKYFDSIPPEDIPHILQTGHIHTSFYMKLGDTHCFQTGCLQDLTPYARSLGFASDKSCWWVDVYFDNRGHLCRVNQELEVFGDKKLTRRR